MSAALEPSTTIAPEPGHAPQLASALPDFALAAVYLIAWAAPGLLNPGVPRILVLTLLMEFIVIHSAAFMGMEVFARSPKTGRGARVSGGVLVGLFYTIFVGGFALSFHTAWPLISFWILVANRLTPILLGHVPTGQEFRTIRASWAGTAVCYLGCIAIACVAPIPRWGCTPDAVAALHLTTGGMSSQQPWKLLAAGALYFAAVGTLELSSFAAFAQKVISDPAADAYERHAA